MTGKDAERTTDRQERIPGFRQSVIQNAKVMVIGAGATGNEVLKNLALTGFGYVFISDMDTISTSNLSRTVLFTPSDLGKPKAETAAQRYIGMNICHGTADYFDGDVCYSLGEGIVRRFDLVINCVDNDQTRLQMTEICQRLGIPFIDLGIGGFDWNVFISSGAPDSPCFACTMSAREEAQSQARVRNSCDVTRKKLAAAEKVPTIAISSSMAAAKAVEEAIKILHYKENPDSQLPPPQFGYMMHYNGRTSIMQRIKFRTRQDCKHHDSYAELGGVLASPLSAHMTLREVLNWVNKEYGGEYSLSISNDLSCVDRAFITTAHCVHCGKPLEIYKPQALIAETDVLCDNCRQHGLLPERLSGGIKKTVFSIRDEDRILDMTLTDIGVPLGHIVTFEDAEEMRLPMFVELSKDIQEVLPHLS